VLKDDPNLPFLRMAWSHSGMAEFFGRHILPVHFPGQEVVNVGIQDMTYFAGRRCDILYSLQLSGLPDEKAAWVVVTFIKDNRAERIFARHYRRNEGATAGLPSLPAVFLADYQCLVERFPADWGLPSLAEAMDPGEVASLFSRLGLHDASTGWLDVKVLRYRPRLRCVIRYVPASPRGQRPRPVVGKIYPPGPKAAQAWHALNTLHVQSTEDVTIPQPLGLVEDRNLVLMECVPGTSMKEALEKATTRDQAVEIIKLAVRSLTWLHSLKFESPVVWSLKAQLDHLRVLNARVELVAPELAEQVKTLLDQIAAFAPQSALATLSCIHGDCKPSQFLISGRRVGLVDFDWACIGDIAVDVGSFMAALHKEAVRGREDARELAGYFLGEYERCSRQRDLVNRVRVFQTTALVRMAVRSFKRSPYRYAHSGPDSMPVRLLQEAATCLVNP
jgi:Ser/Thr protein kinase RdoA (MazF antagonist)